MIWSAVFGLKAIRYLTRVAIALPNAVDKETS